MSKQPLNKSFLLYFITIYSFLISISIIFVSLYNFVIFFSQSYVFTVTTGFATCLLLPIHATSNLIIAIIAFIGSIYLFIRKRIGLYLILFWSLLQIPTFIYIYGVPSKEAWASSLTLQLFYYGKAWIRTIYDTPFTLSPKPYLSYGFGINYIGIILFSIVILIFIKETYFFKRYKLLNITEKALGITKIILYYIIRITDHALVATLIGIIIITNIPNYTKNCKLDTKVNEINIVNSINYTTQNGQL